MSTSPIQLIPTLQAALRGERQAQQHLYEALAPQVLGVCLLYARDRSEADDFAQDCWVQALTHLGDFRHEGPFEAWLRRIAVTTCLKQLRRKRPEMLKLGNGEKGLKYELTHLDPSIVAQLDADELLAYVHALPEGYRLVFNLVALEGYSHAEAAQMLGISESSSRSQLTRARQSLQYRLNQIFALCL